MIFRSYGLFWRLDEIDWYPGKGQRNSFRLLGRSGANRNSIRISDFRHQVGIYILYGNYGPHYVGLARKSLGNRLKNHLSDKHEGLWDRFSWFGFKSVLSKRDGNGLGILKDMPGIKITDPEKVIRDAEALLIKAMALKNINKMNFVDAECWTQINIDEVEKYTARL